MFRSYQTILRELCLVVKLLRAAYFCTSLVMWEHDCNYKVCLKTLFDLPLLRYFVLSLHGEQISSCLITLRSGYVPLSLLMCLLRGLVLYYHCVACFHICFLNKFEEGVIFV